MHKQCRDEKIALKERKPLNTGLLWRFFTDLISEKENNNGGKPEINLSWETTNGRIEQLTSSHAPCEADTPDTDFISR